MRSLLDVSHWLVKDKPLFGASFATAIRMLQTAEPRDMRLLREEYRRWLCEECPVDIDYHRLKKTVSIEIARQAQLVASGPRDGESVDLRLIADIGPWAHDRWVFTHDSRYNILGRAARGLGDGASLRTVRLQTIAAELGVGTRFSGGRSAKGTRVRGRLPDFQLRARIAETVVAKAVALQASEAWPPAVSMPGSPVVVDDSKFETPSRLAGEKKLESCATMSSPCKMAAPAAQKVQHSDLKPVSSAISEAARIVGLGEAAPLGDVRKAARGLHIPVRARIGKRKMEARRLVTKEKLLQQLTARVEAGR